MFLGEVVNTPAAGESPKLWG